MPEGTSMTITALAKKIGIHYSTVSEKIDEYELAKDIGWTNIRDRNRKVRLILRTDEDLVIMNALAEINKEIISMNNRLDKF